MIYIVYFAGLVRGRGKGYFGCERCVRVPARAARTLLRDHRSVSHFYCTDNFFLSVCAVHAWGWEYGSIYPHLRPLFPPCPRPSSSESEANKAISSPFGQNYVSDVPAIAPPMYSTPAIPSIQTSPLPYTTTEPGADTQADVPALSPSQLPHPHHVHTTQTPKHATFVDPPTVQPLA